MPKHTTPEPIVEILDYGVAERETEDYETWKLERRRWSDAELIAYARKGHVEAGDEVAWRAVRDLGRGTLSPELTDWLTQLLDHIRADPELQKRLLAPRPHRGRRPATRDLATTDQRERLKAWAIAEVEWRMKNPTYHRNMTAIFDDVAVLASRWSWPAGIKPPNAATVKKWYHSRSRDIFRPSN